MRQPLGTRRARIVVALMGAALAGSLAIAPAAAQTAEIEYAIWGDPAELTNQIALVDAFMAAHPDIKVNVTVSDWEP